MFIDFEFTMAIIFFFFRKWKTPFKVKKKYYFPFVTFLCFARISITLLFFFFLLHFVQFWRFPEVFRKSIIQDGGSKKAASWQL